MAGADLTEELPGADPAEAESRAGSRTGAEGRERRPEEQERQPEAGAGRREELRVSVGQRPVAPAVSGWEG